MSEAKRIPDGVRYPALYAIATEYERQSVMEPYYRSPWEAIGLFATRLIELIHVVSEGDPTFAVRHHAIALGVIVLKFLLSQPTWEE